MLGFGLPILTVPLLPTFFSFVPKFLWPLVRVGEFLATGIGPLLYAVITGGVLSYWIRVTRPAT